MLDDMVFGNSIIDYTYLLVSCSNSGAGGGDLTTAPDSVLDPPGAAL